MKSSGPYTLTEFEYKCDVVAFVKLETDTDVYMFALLKDRDFDLVRYILHKHDLSVVNSIDRLVKNYDTIMPLFREEGRPLLKGMYFLVEVELDIEYSIPEHFIIKIN